MSDVSQIDGIAIRLKREAQGWALTDLANRACLSVKQIRQIEEGGMTAFYSESVKLTAARKVAGLLQMSDSQLFGQQAPPPVDLPEEDHLLHASAHVDSPVFAASLAAAPAPAANPLMRSEALHELAQPPEFIDEGPADQAPVALKVAEPEPEVVAETASSMASPVETKPAPEPEPASGSGYMLKIAVLFLVALAAAALLRPKALEEKADAPVAAETPAASVVIPNTATPEDTPAADATAAPASASRADLPTVTQPSSSAPQAAPASPASAVVSPTVPAAPAAAPSAPAASGK